MQINGKEYEIKPNASLRQSKLLILTNKAYQDYIDADDKTEDEKYQVLKGLWKLLISQLVKDPEENISNLDMIPIETYKELLSSFFPQSSEVKT